MENRPEGREKKVTGKGKGLYKRGAGLGTGSVGREDSYQGKPQPYGGSSGGGRRAAIRAAGGGGGLILVLLAVLLLSKGGGLSGLLGGGGAAGSFVPTTVTQSQQQSTGHYGSSGGSILESLLGGLSGGGNALSFGGSPSVSTGWVKDSNVGRLNETVAAGARDKYTRLQGGGRDTVTMMVYMCGTDLESRSRMGTMDLQEMLEATVSNPRLNLIVYTGGCRQWQNNVVSSTVNQIYQIRDGQLKLLAEDGAKVMTDPDTLVGFVKYCRESFPAKRNMLIFWDHGGGSLSGYGYDEKHKSAGSMGLAQINRALEACGMTFDFIGFDACLMATLETGLMLEPYADYMIASEETEPGVGWYYTNWLKALDKNTSLPTLTLGKAIVDDFVTECAGKCRGQATTLSVVDLAELAHTVPDKLSAFAAGTSRLLQSKQYKTVSDARSMTREFAASTRIDQVDLAHLAYNMDTKESRALAEALVGAVKYNRTSGNMTNAYGLSIYFPYQNAGKVSAAVSAYKAIGMDGDYARVIQQFASMESGGQGVATGGGSGGFSPLDAILGGGASGSGGSAMGLDAIGSLLGGLLGGGRSLADIGLNESDTAAYLAEHRLDTDAMRWTRNSRGESVLHLSEEQWALVHDLQLNVWVDDGEGYLDLGLDCVYDFTDEGDLLGIYDGTWLAIDGQVVAFYYVDSTMEGDSFTIRGRVPCLLNGQRAELLIVFDNENPFGAVAGARAVYADGETETVAKNELPLQAGDRLDFLCDYYTYAGRYSDTFMLGEQMVWTGKEEVSSVDISDYRAAACYLVRDMYGQEYWTPTMP